MLYNHAGLIQFIYLHQVLVPLENDLLDLDLLWLLHLQVRGLRDLFKALLTDEDGGALIHTFLKFVMRVLTSQVGATLRLQVAFEMLLVRGCIV